MVDLAYLNAVPPAEFVSILSDIFEHSPWVAEAVAPQRPFARLEDLHAAMSQAVRDGGEARQLALIRAHPDLAGKAARAGALTEYSTREQSSAGLDRLSDAEYERFHNLNNAYRQRFDFPFIVCVRKTNKAGILKSYEARLQNNRATEVKQALHEIDEIARLRLEALLLAKE